MKKIFILKCSDNKGTVGGVDTFTNNLVLAIKHAGLEAEYITQKALFKKSPSDCDAILFTSLGIDGEKKATRDFNLKRLENLKKNFVGKVPIIAVVHDVKEKSVYKDSYNFFFENSELDCVLSIEENETFKNYIDSVLKYKNIFYIKHPFIFDKNLLEDKKKYKKNIASISRLASCKNITKVIEIAALLPNYDFQIHGNKKGFYWYWQLSKLELPKNVEMPGFFESVDEVLKKTAFVIDLSYFQYKGFVDSGRTQYTILEAVNNGCIPIGFDVWYNGDYSGIFLESPKKVGRKRVFDIERHAKTIKEYEYDFSIAEFNFKNLKRKYNYTVVGNKLKKIFKEIGL